MPRRWWIDICPECNGQVGELSQTHTGTCPNGGPNGRAFIPRTIEVTPAMRAVGDDIDMPDAGMIGDGPLGF